MSFRQVYYTSCKTGLRGGKGFQVNAATPGIAPALLQQVERLGVYAPPMSAPLRPTPEQVGDFPLTLLYSRLADQSGVALQARYTGVDYSGRFGNYFAHSLVSALPDDDFTGLPIELWRSHVWNTVESPVTTLPELDDVPMGGDINPETVRAFLATGDRMSLLPAYLTAVEQALKTRRRVIVVDQCDAVACWIAAASYALPRHHALRLTFNTYLKNPYHSDALITGTSAGSDFKFAPHEMERQFFVFDFVGRRFTRVGEPSEYARMATRMYASGSVDDLASFGAPGAIPPEVGLDELSSALAFHAQARGVSLDGPADVVLLRWAAGHVGGLDAAAVEAMFHRALAAGGAAGELSQVCADVVAASRARPSLQARLEPAYVRWVMEALLPSAPGPALRAVAQRLDLLPETVDSIAPYQESWEQRTLRSRDAADLAGCLLLGEALGFLDARFSDRQRYEGEALAAWLEHHEARAAIRDVAVLGNRPMLVKGMVTRLAAADAAPLIAAVGADEALALAFETAALPEGNLSLMFRLAGARMIAARQPRTATVKALVEAVVARHDLGAPVIDQMLDALWGATPLSLAEAAALVDPGLFRSLPTVALSSVPARAALALENADLSGVDPQRDKLAQALLSAPLSERLSDAARAMIRVVYVIGMLRRGGEAPVDLMLDGLRCLPRVSPTLQVRLFDDVARRVVDVADFAGARRILEALLRHDPDRAVRVYGSGLEQALAPGRGAAEATAARAFSVLTLIGADAFQNANRSMREGAYKLLDEHLPRAVRARKLAMDEIEKAIHAPRADEIEVLKAFDVWRKKHAPSLLSSWRK